MHAVYLVNSLRKGNENKKLVNSQHNPYVLTILYKFSCSLHNCIITYKTCSKMPI